MSRKTESLAYPPNPLAAMRDLHDLDGPPEAPGTEPVTQPRLTAVQPPQPPASADAPLTPRAAGGGREAKQRRAGPGQAAGAAPGEGEDRMRAAILDTLRQPYAPDWSKGPHTATTVKIPRELWERLAWAARLTGQPKQEIIAEALGEHLHRLGKAR